MRFFFDYTTKGKSLFDYRGDVFGSPNAAIDFAEAIVTDLKNRLSNDWKDWSIEVRNADGIKFYSMPVDAPELGAT